MGVPIVIGVTGHRNLRSQDLLTLRTLVSDELNKFKTQYPNSEWVMLNSIASGADTLCAQEALALGMKLVCPLPMELSEYRKDFSGEDLVMFEKLLSQASDVFVAPDTEHMVSLITDDPDAVPSRRDYQYRQAGIYVAAHSHVLLALWDGQPGTPHVCGTAEAVDFMQKGTKADGAGHFKAQNDGAVLHIVTPRENQTIPLEITVSLLENEPGALAESLLLTDTFNADSKKAAVFKIGENSLLPHGTVSQMDDCSRQIHSLYQTANRLSLYFQQKAFHALRCFSVFGVLLVLFFLFYDELECNLFLLFYGAIMAVYALVFVLIRKGSYHQRYLQYRILAETLRVQFYLKAAGIEDNIGTAFTWTQKQELTWIKQAVSSLLIGSRKGQESCSIEIIKEAWIDGQLSYHQSALKKDLLRHRTSEQVSFWMLIASLLFFVLVLALEFLPGSLMTVELFHGCVPAILLHHPEQTFTLRSLMKVLLGGISAVTVFLANYYGKLSLERKSKDHERMVKLYSSAKEQFENGTASRKQLFPELAREEIIENGNWFSYCSENPPSFNL